MPAPITFLWDGECFIPHKRFQAECDRSFVIGQHYRLAVHDERSGDSHRHFFAQVREAWLNLPEHLAERFPNATSLRKHALCRAGFCDDKRIVCTSRAQAERIFSALAADYDMALLDGSVVTLFKAHSQDYAHMGRKAFQESKERTLQVIAEMIGIDPETLADNAGKAA